MSTTQPRKPRNGWMGFAVFLMVVLIGGLVLTATGNMDDPFTNMSDIIDMRQMLAATRQSEGSAGSDLATPVSTNADRGITLSAVGEVVYDLWFITATTAAFIAVSVSIKWVVKQVSHKRFVSSTHHSRGQDPPAI